MDQILKLGNGIQKYIYTKMLDIEKRQCYNARRKAKAL